MLVGSFTLVVFGMIIALPLAVTDKLAFDIDTKTTTNGTAGASFMKLTKTSAPEVIPLLKGLYDSKGVMSITIEVSDKKMRDQIGNCNGQSND